MVKTKKKKKAADVEAIARLVSESGLPVFRIEKELGIGRSVLLRGLQKDTKRPLPPRWELPLLKYLKKKVAETTDIEIQTTAVKLELGLPVEEKQSDLPEEKKEGKRTWVELLGGDE